MLDRAIRQRWMVRASILAAVCLLVPVTAAADDHEAPQMSAEEQAMMEAWQEAMTPGEEHEWLASHAGEYDMVVKIWTSPDREPDVSDGTATIESIMGGRMLRETVDSSAMGQPFHGEGLSGYDNVTGRYWGTWVDNMSTGVGVSWGEREGDKLIMQTTAADPMSGVMKTNRSTMTYTDDGMVMEAFATMDGKEMRTMEITYTKK